MEVWIKRIIVSLFVFFPVQAIASAERDPEKVISTNTCAECHEEAIDVWKQTKHFETYRNFHKTKEAKDIAISIGMDPKKIKRADSMCADCHYTKGVKNNRIKPIAGISCQSCHGAAQDWVEIHNDYGGAGITSKTESDAHKKQRYSAMHSNGMVYPANLYGLAENCFQCHLIANPELINGSDHPTSSDFDLVERSQSDISHYPEADASKRSKLAIAGLSAQLVQSLEALAKSPVTGRYSEQMTVTAKHAAENFRALSKQTSDPSLNAIVASLNKLEITAGNNALTKASKAIEKESIKLVGVEGSVSQTKTLVKVSITPKVKVKPKTSAAKPKVPSRVTSSTPPAAISNAKVKSIKAVAEEYVALSKVQQTLISTFTAHQPVSTVMCRSRAPWMRGRYPLQLKQFRSDSSCFGVSVEKAKDTKLVILSQGEHATIRLFPNQCGFLGGEVNSVASNQSIDLPLNANQQASTITLSTQPNTLIAVVADARADAQYQSLLDKTTDVCRMISADRVELLQLLNQLNSQSNNGLQWLEYQ